MIINTENFKTSQQFASKFSYTVVAEMHGRREEITPLIKEIKELSYQLNGYASLELVLLDREKRIFSHFIPNSMFKIEIMITDWTGFSLIFKGYMRKFTPIDVENDLYVMSVWSPWEFQNLKIIRKGFSESKSPSSILQSLVEDLELYPKNKDGELESLFIVDNSDESIQFENFIVPNWNFYSTVQYLKQFSMDENKNIFYFYEDPAGIKYISKHTMLNASMKAGVSRFIFTPNQISVEEVGKYESIEKRAGEIVPLNAIYKYDIITSVDFTKHLKQRDFGFSYQFLNYKEGEIVNNKSDFNENIKNTTTLGYHIYINQDDIKSLQDYHIIDYTENEGLVDSYGNYHSQKSLMDNLKIQIVVNGNLIMSPGRLVYIEYPLIASSSEILSGLWMVDKVIHNIKVSDGLDRQQKFYTTLILCRDSLSVKGDLARILNMYEKEHQTVEGM